MKVLPQLPLPVVSVPIFPSMHGYERQSLRRRFGPLPSPYQEQHKSSSGADSRIGLTGA
jgi:hypothetical protein